MIRARSSTVLRVPRCGIPADRRLTPLKRRPRNVAASWSIRAEAPSAAAASRGSHR
jgi:hypothetical protein